MAQDIVIGIDGGGTHTRVLAVGTDGLVLSTVETGGSHPGKQKDAKQNVRTAIIQAVKDAGASLDDVKSIVSGLAGLDDEQDHIWAEELTAVPGLLCPRVQVNDAVVAHAGAFVTNPGIVVISGTGSIIFAVNEHGRHIRNYDFHHYAATAARHLAYAAVYLFIADEGSSSDEQLTGELFSQWKVNSLRELAELASGGFVDNRMERDRLFGNMAPHITQAAVRGVPLAKQVCDEAAHALAVGVRLLGSCFDNGAVDVACIGSVARHPYINDALQQALSQRTGHEYRVVEPVVAASAGAALMALKHVGFPVTDRVVNNLKRHPKSVQF